MKVSAVVPVFNSLNTLNRAINSLLIQPEINEIFLVDDGSTDGSYDLILSLEKNHLIIKVLTHVNRINKGAAASRNLGLNYCSNEWVQFLDADDELLPNKISNQLVYANSNVGCIVSPYFYIKNGKTYHHDFFFCDVWVSLLLSRLGRTSSMIWNSKILKSIQWREEMPNAQEYYMLFDVLSNDHLIAISNNINTAVYHQIGSISTSMSSEKINNLLDFRIMVRDFLISSKKYSFLYFYYFNISIGKIYKNFKPTKNVFYLNSLYFLHRVLNKFIFRLE